MKVLEKDVPICGRMTLPSTYTRPHPCEKKVAKPGQICAHHQRVVRVTPKASR
jgi:hypothetical protein